MDAKLLVVLILCFVSVHCQGPVASIMNRRGVGRPGPPKPKGCTPGCGPGDICGMLGKGYKGRYPTDAVCIDMKSIRLPAQYGQTVGVPNIAQLINAAGARPPTQGLFGAGGGGIQDLLNRARMVGAPAISRTQRRQQRAQRPMSMQDMLMYGALGGGDMFGIFGA